MPNIQMIKTGGKSRINQLHVKDGYVDNMKMSNDAK
jgi:hypothetical protein